MRLDQGGFIIHLFEREKKQQQQKNIVFVYLPPFPIQTQISLSVVPSTAFSALVQFMRRRVYVRDDNRED